MPENIENHVNVNPTSPHRRALLIAGGAAAMALTTGVQAQSAPIRIGAILTSSGLAGAIGEAQTKTLELMVEQTNSSGGILGRKLQLVIYDDGGDSQKATVFAKRLIESDKVDAIVGPSTSGSSLAIIPIIQQAGIPNISMAAASAVIDPVKSWVFKTTASDVIAARAIFLHMRKEGIKRVAILHDTTGFGRSAVEQFRKSAQLLDISVVAVESFDPKDTDTSTQINKAKAASPDAFLVLAIPPTPALVTKNFRDLKLTMPLYHAHGAASDEYLKLAGAAAEGTRLPVPPLALPASDQDTFRTIIERYSAAYQKKYKIAPTGFGGYAHDALLLLTVAIAKAGTTDKAKVRATLEMLSDVKGVGGTFSFNAKDHLGLGADALPMAVVRDGAFRRIR